MSMFKFALKMLVMIFFVAIGIAESASAMDDDYNIGSSSLSSSESLSLLLSLSSSGGGGSSSASISGHKCELCPSSHFASTNKLKVHYTRAHPGVPYPGVDEKPFKCDQCPTDFASNFAFKRHMQREHGDTCGRTRPYLLKKTSTGRNKKSNTKHSIELSVSSSSAVEDSETEMLCFICKDSLYVPPDQEELFGEMLQAEIFCPECDPLGSAEA